MVKVCRPAWKVGGQCGWSVGGERTRVDVPPGLGADRGGWTVWSTWQVGGQFIPSFV